MARIIELVGSVRPDYVRLAPVVRAMKAHGVAFQHRLVHVGRGYVEPVSAELLESLQMPGPDVFLDVGSGKPNLAGTLAAYEQHLRRLPERPSGLVVVGDTEAALACALGAVKVGLAVAHIEAGLRTFDRTMPEEAHRVITDAIAELCLVSEPMGESNLSREGVPARRIRLVGNAMVDSVQHHLRSARALDMRARLGLAGPYGYVTIHRSSNIDDPVRLAEVVELIERLSDRVDVVFPVHPRMRSRLAQFGLSQRLENNPKIHVRGALGYVQNLGVLCESRLIATDSAGIQDEASFLGIPCLTLLGNTERSAATEIGTSTLVGSLGRFLPLVDEALAGRPPIRSIPFWDGHAADRIVYELVRAWGGSLPPAADRSSPRAAGGGAPS